MHNLDQNENGSIQNMNIERTIDRMTNEQKNEFISKCYRKLSRGSVLSLQGLDLPSFCKGYLFTKVDPQVIFGLNSVTSVEEMSQILQQNRFKITHMTIKDGLYNIEATK